MSPMATRLHGLFSDLGSFLHHVGDPAVTVTPAPPWLTRTIDVEVPVTDGTILRVDVYSDARDDAPRPVILSAHPYGKDHLPHRRGPVWLISPQYRMFRLPTPITFSEYTGWEAPDPAFWVENGYTVVNGDLRGCGTSDGSWNPFSVEEGNDITDMIEWIAAQPWCDGSVGMLGVSYLAIAQYEAAQNNPPHLKAICPWEGFTDLYRDFARPGGIPETGFLKLWSHVTSTTTRTDVNLSNEVRDHELDDEFYAAHRPALDAIRVPMLVCGSFSDHNLHSRGSFEAFRRAEGAERWLWTHRGGKWSTFYSDEAQADQLAFFDHFLRGIDNGWRDRPAVRLSTHDGDHEVIEHIGSFPPSDIMFHPLHLHADGSLGGDQGTPGSVDWADRSQTLDFTFTLEEPMTLTGPMELRLRITSTTPDADIVVTLDHRRDGERVPYEGSYGFGRDFVTHGMVRISEREVDEVASSLGFPILTHRKHEPVAEGEVVTLRIPLLPSSTALRPGDDLHLSLRADWPWPHDPVRGQFPAAYDTIDPDGSITVLVGGEEGSTLWVPQRETAVR